MKSLLFIVGILYESLLFSQQEKKVFIGLDFGKSIPRGNFADHDWSNGPSGFAKEGYMAELNLGYKFLDQVGIMAKIRQQSHPFDNNENENYRMLYLYGPEEKSNNWKTNGAYSGIFVTLPLSSRGEIIFELYVLGGISQTVKPEFEYTHLSRMYVENYSYPSRKATSAGLIYGGGFKFFTFEKIAFNLNADYYTSSVEFPESEYSVEVSNGWSSEYSLKSYKQNIQTINISFGLSYFF